MTIFLELGTPWYDHIDRDTKDDYNDTKDDTKDDDTDLCKAVNHPYKERKGRPGEAQGAMLRTTELSEPE